MKASVWSVCLFLWLAGAVFRAEALSTNYPTGLIPYAEEIRDGLAPDIEWIRGAADLKKLGRALRALPSSCANTLYLPAVRYQLLANCGAYAPSYYYKTYQEAREHGWVRPDPSVNPERVMSPGFTFPLTNRGRNAGAGLSTVMSVICRYGIATWKDMPESHSWWEYPADDIWAKALPYRGDRVIGFDLSTDVGMQAMKQHLVDGDLGVFEVPISSTFANYPSGAGVDSEVIYDNGAIYDSHALTLIGYDDARTYNDGTGVKRGAFLAVNSWGSGWGVVETNVGTAGFCWLSYEYMRSRRAGATFVLAMIDRTNYVPREVAVIEVSHDVRSELDLDIASGNGAGSTNALEAFPWGGGPLPYHGTITVDVTDFMADLPDVYHLYALDWDSATVGTISRFEVRKANGFVLTCLDTPVTLTNSDAVHYPEGWHVTRLDVGLLEREDARIWEEEMQTPVFTWVDFDRDGDADLVVCGLYVTDRYAGIYINDGCGNFVKRDAAELASIASNARLAWGDYNQDGYPDLAVSGRNAGNEPVTMLLRNEGGVTLVNSGSAPVETGLAWGDYDNDGDLDLATSAGKLYCNDNGNFVDTGFTLIGGDTSKSISWADVDNDGLLDLEINGKINQNLGGSFTNDPLNGPTIGCFGDVPPIWHDFNGDGLLDAAAGGRIYQNRGYVYQPGYHDPEHPEYDIPDQWRLWFEPGAAFPNWSWPRVSMGDYDNDGDLDLVLSGVDGSNYDVRCSVFRQEADQSFTDIGLLLSGFYAGDVGWQDWDGDGDLDLLAAGMDSTFAPKMAVLKNRLADLGRPNQPPEAPQRFQAVCSGASLLLQWQPAEDAETPATRLAYEVRVGRYPGRSDVVSPCDSGPVPGNARLIGALSLPANPTPYQTFYNTNGLPGLRLRTLAAGRYYWSVRTVDGGLARSPWGAEQSFTLTAAGLRTGDINGDGKVDVADLVCCRKMITGAFTPNVATADLNNDGAVNDPDAVLLTDLLLEIEAGGYVPVAEGTIGPAGGTLSSGQFSLTVPAGAFSEPSELQLLIAADDRWFGENSPRLMWRIRGLPSTMTGTLTLSGPDLRVSPTSAVVLALGQWGRPYGVNDNTLEPIRTFSAVPGTVSGGRLVTQVPAELLSGAGTFGGGAFIAKRAKAAYTGPVKVDIDVGWLSGVREPSVRTTHFVIFWGGGAMPAYAISLARELEDAFSRFQTMGFPFVDKRDWVEYPMQIWLRVLINPRTGNALDGGEVHYNDNGAYIELNINSMADDALRRITVCHELFHLVQGLVNPTDSITENNDQNLLLVNEATATWMERYGAAVPGSYVPPTYEQNQLRVFDGLSYGALAGATEAGYACSSMIEYLVGKNGEGTVLQIYNRIAAGDDAVTAVLRSSVTSYLFWHHDFYQSLVEGSVYAASPLLNITRNYTPLWPAADHTHTFSDPATVASFAVILPGLGADGWRIAFTPGVVAQLTNTSELVFSLQNQCRDLKLAVVSAQVHADSRGYIPVESYGTKQTVIRCRVPNLKNALPAPSRPQIPWRSFVAVVTRTDASNPDMAESYPLKVAVAERLEGQLAPLIFTHGSSCWWNDLPLAFPTFECTARLTVNNLTAQFYSGVSKTTPESDVGYAFLKIFQDDGVPVGLVFSGVPTGALTKDVNVPGAPLGDFWRFTFKSVSGYKICKRLYNGPKWEDQPYVFTNRPFSGTETLTLEEGEEHVFYGISIDYLFEEQDFVGGVSAGSPFTWEILTEPVFIHLERE